MAGERRRRRWWIAVTVIAVFAIVGAVVAFALSGSDWNFEPHGTPPTTQPAARER